MSGGHTPGPWKIFTVQDGPNKGQLLGVGQQTGEGVTDAYGGLWGSGPEQMANAHLIAAAPDLLEALILARRYVADVPIVGDADLAVIDAALAKARQSTPAPDCDGGGG